MPTLIVPRGHANTQQACDLLRPALHLPQITLDLSQLTFVGPLFLVRLRAWLDLHSEAGVQVKVVPPARGDVCRYMSRMHVHHGLGPNVEFALPDVNEADRGDRLIAVTKLDATGNSQFDELLGDLLDSPDMAGASYLAEVVDGAAQEMALNAVDHGANSTGAYVAAQRFRRPRAAVPFACVLAVGDLGIGMAEHLRRGGQDRGTDAATIIHGLDDLVSGTGDQWRGRGYSVPFELAAQKSAAYTELRVRANGGWVVKRSDRAAEEIKLVRPDSGPGTWVEFEFGHADT
ncbi:MAG: hypothetical protein REI11_04635 [Patulibacter sp.]|nr:hypothetical protein [Patulibacter sp.]